MPPSPSGVAMAAIVSACATVLSLFEEGTGFLVAFAVKIMEQVGVCFFGQLPGQCLQPREQRAQIRLGICLWHVRGGLLQCHQRFQDFLFGLCHKLIYDTAIQREKHGENRFRGVESNYPLEDLQQTRIAHGQF
jgi:hypothetical protein